MLVYSAASPLLLYLARTSALIFSWSLVSMSSEAIEFSICNKPYWKIHIMILIKHFWWSNHDLPATFICRWCISWTIWSVSLRRVASFMPRYETHWIGIAYGFLSLFVRTDHKYKYVWGGCFSVFRQSSNKCQEDTSHIRYFPRNIRSRQVKWCVPYFVEQTRNFDRHFSCFLI